MTLTAHKVVAITHDGKLIAKASSYLAVADIQTPTPINITIPDLAYIDTILQVEFYTSPDTFIDHYMDKRIHGNVVGMTIYGLAAKTTLTIEVVAIGPGAP